MSTRQLSQPCWTIHGWNDLDHDGAHLHYTSRADAAADADAFMDNGTAEGADLAPVHEDTPCWVLDCDGCGIPAEDDSGGTAHYPGAEDTNGEDGWIFHPDGTAYCPGCALAAECREYGHHYTPWRDCACGGTHHRHTNGCPQFRYCQRCLTYQPSWPSTHPRKDCA